jgi:nitroreductase
MRSSRREFVGISLGLAVTCSLPGQSVQPGLRLLPKPRTEGGKPLMQTLMERKSSRAFATRKLPDQVLSDLLWAAWGINRPDGRRTAPSAMNRQEIDLYLILPEAALLYDAQEHGLRQLVTEDLRSQAGSQPFVQDAPLNLIYVADLAKSGGESEQDKILYYGSAAGFISQNVYLYCASEGLATVVRAYVERDALAQSLSLRAEQRIVFAQSVGYPA